MKWRKKKKSFIFAKSEEKRGDFRVRSSSSSKNVFGIFHPTAAAVLFRLLQHHLYIRVQQRFSWMMQIELESNRKHLNFLIIWFKLIKYLMKS